MADIIATIGENLILFSFLGGAVVALLAVAWAFARVYGEKYRAASREASLAQAKLAAVVRRQELEDLAKAAVVLKDDERQRLDAIREDVAVLSRRNLALMAELDARLTRLERGVEHARMSGQLGEVQKKERRLFAAVRG